MTYKECKTAALQLIFSESIAGTEIEYSYNNQADYIRKIVGQINDAQVYFATAVKKIPEVYPLDRPDYSTDLFDVYTLPRNCYQLMNGGLLVEVKDPWNIPQMPRFHGYKLVAGNKLYIPKGMTGLVAEYWRFPNKLPLEPDDDMELDNTEEVQAIIPIYVAAKLVQYEDALRYVSLWNEVEARIARITEPTFVEHGRVADHYCGFYGGAY